MDKIRNWYKLEFFSRSLHQVYSSESIVQPGKDCRRDLLYIGCMDGEVRGFISRGTVAYLPTPSFISAIVQGKFKKFEYVVSLPREV